MTEHLKNQTGHQTVLLEEAITALSIQPNDCVVDATIGGAGHFAKILQALGPKGTLIGIDADEEALERGRNAVSAVHGNESMSTIHLVNDNFRNLGTILDTLAIRTIDKSLFDLGWSGYQLSRGKGFSFQQDEPLIMTYGEPHNGSDETMQTAADVVNGASEEALATIIYELGEEQFSRKIAKAIVEYRHKHRILTTFQLVDAIKQGTPSWYHHRKLHPATKTFQALRIYVNDELGALKEGLETAMQRTSPGGKVAVITFHSIEDRIVKNLFRDAMKEGEGELGTKKPMGPSFEELKANPRARSAKLRVFVRST